MQLRLPLAMAALMVLAACTGLPPGAREILDERNGATLFVVTKPLVFARERTDVAAHARDYVTLVAVAVDESGTFAEYVLVHRWSTVDRRMLPAPDPKAGQLRIVAEGRTIDLLPLEQVPASLSSQSELYEPKHTDGITRAYKIELATLRFIAGSSVLTVRMPQEPLDTPFKLWGDGRANLTQFVMAQGARER